MTYQIIKADRDSFSHRNVGKTFCYKPRWFTNDWNNDGDVYSEYGNFVWIDDFYIGFFRGADIDYLVSDGIIQSI